MNFPLLQIENLSKNFGTLEAVSDISFSIDEGEIVGVVGQRGSGKTVLFKLIDGIEHSSKGNIVFNNQKIDISSPDMAHHLGIEAVLEMPLIVNNLNITRNIFLGREIRWPNENGFMLDFPQMYARAKELVARFDVPESILLTKPTDLSIEEKTIVALARALCTPSKLLLLDNTLASLSYPRQQQLLYMIKELSAKDTSIIISSDDLKSLFSITDRLLVMFEGSIIAKKVTRDSTPREIVELMVGTDIKDRVTPVIWAIENYHAIRIKAEELFLSQQNLKENLETQGTLNAELIQKLQDQIKASEQLTIALRAANMRIMSEREEERKIIAREIHDQTIQDLLTFNFRIEQMEEEHSGKKLTDELSYIREGIRRIIIELRNLCSDLRPPTIDSLGLASALRSLIREWSARNQSLEIAADIDEGLGRFSEPIELSIFRIVQEGLNNIAKHSDANSVQLIIRRTSNSSVELRITDDGKGINNDVNFEDLSSQQHYGLIGISERVALLGGTFNIRSPKQGGVELHIEILNPYP